MKTNNWHKQVVYQIYPKSFQDSNGDGIGDLRGIIDRLPYLAELGIDMIWLNPIYPSPQYDNGYDVSDYCAINPLFGTMDDFETLVQQAKKHNIGIMLDMVLNHTSTEHEWFKRACAGEEKYQNYYIIREGKADGEPPTNWSSKFGGSAWARFDNSSNRYYLHLFDPHQADLNWDNPELRKELYEVVRFWMAKGISGFRFDVINLISKPAHWDDDFEGDGRRFYTDGANVHEYIKELNRETFEEQAITTVGEMSSTSIENCIRYSGADEHELNMIFRFQHLKVDYTDGEKWTDGMIDFPKLNQEFHSWQSGLSEHNGWEALFWNNHDQPRAISRFGYDEPQWRYYGATLLASCIHFMRGTPYIYMGEEIGMMNPYFDDIATYQDIETQNYYQIMREQNRSHEETMRIIQKRSRDNSRVPMQWSAQEHAGFSTSAPWLSIADSYQAISVEKDQKASQSIFAFYQQLIRLRKEYDIVSEGNYTPIETEDAKVIAYRRNYNGKTLHCFHNFAKEERIVRYALKEYAPTEVLLSNYEEHTDYSASSITLRPLESIVLYT